MRTILDVNDDVEFLGIIYNSMDSISDLIEKVGVEEIRSRLPEFSEDDADEDKIKKIREQSKKNLMEMARGFLVDYPNETVKLLHSFIILEKGEKYPQGFDLIAVAMQCICDRRVIDFFSSLARLNAMR